MSIKIMTNVWSHSAQKGGRLLLLLALADFSNDDGLCWPAIATLSHKSRLSRRSVQGHIHALIDAGELEIVELGGGRKSTRYRVLSSAESAPLDDSQDADCSPGVQNLHPSGEAHCTPEVRPIAPEPLLEPLNENVKESSVVSYDQTPWVMALTDVRNAHYRKNKANWETSPWVQTWVVAGSDGHMVIGCTTEDDAAWLADRGSAVARHALTGVLGRQVDVEFLGPAALQEVMSDAA